MGRGASTPGGEQPDAGTGRRDAGLGRPDAGRQSGPTTSQLMPAAPWFGSARPDGRELVAMAGLVVLAAVARLISLPTRGTWDRDQGHDLLVLRDLVRDGIVPLLGPPTSIGEFHHGALYYYLLAPAAWLGGSDPVAVMAAIALAGIAAVACTWLLARQMGGPVAGMAAGLLMAVSATAVDASTFIWNPNLIPLSSAVTFVALWMAWAGRRPRWWLVVGIAQAVTMQCHVLGAVLLPPLVVMWALDVRRQKGRRRVVVGWGCAGGVALLLSYTPLALHEVQTGFAEARAALDFLASGGTGVALDPVTRLIFVTLRLLAWPLTGQLTSALVAGITAAFAVIAILVWQSRTGDEPRRSGARVIGGVLAFSALALAYTISGLATVTALPTDHYHAFLDPLVYVTVGLGAAALWGRGRTVRLVAVSGVGLLVAFNLLSQPPTVNRDGGWPAAEAVARRVSSLADGRPMAILHLPEFKGADAYRFPLERLGQPLLADLAGEPDAVMILCDSLFVDDCGGPAEDALLAVTQGGDYVLVERFEAAPNRVVSVYRRGGS